MLATILQASQAFKITSNSQLLSGDNALGIVGDYLLKNDSVSFVISDITHLTSQKKYGGNIIDAAFQSGLDDFDLMYLYLDDSYPRQGKYDAINIISSGAPYDSAHIQVRGVDSDNSNISIITDYILYDNTPILKVVSSFENTSATTINNYGLGDAFAWGSTPFVPGGNTSNGWLASQTLNTLYGYIAKENFSATHGSYWSDATLEEVMLSTNVPKAFTRYFMVSNTLGDIYRAFLEIQNLPKGSLSVTVTHNDLPISNAAIAFYQDSDTNPVLTDETNNLGEYNTPLQTGNWICRVTTGAQTKEQSVTIMTGASHELNFSMNSITPPIYKQDTLTIIQSPLINIPTMVLPNDMIKIEIDLAASESVQSIAIVMNGNETELSFVETNDSSPFELRTLNAYLPSELLYGLYDLKLTCTGSDSLDISENAVYVIPEYKKDFTIIQVTDTHLPSHFFWGNEGLEADSTELIDFGAVIEDINIINPDFVIHTGDLINDGEIEALDIPSISRAKALLKKLDVPLFLVAGNHDLGGWDSTPAPDGTARRTWWNFFGWDYLNSLSATATTTQNYSFNYGKVHFIGLEAYDNYDEWRKELYGDNSFISSQMTWLNNDLAAHSSDSLQVLFYHYDFNGELDLSSLGVDIALWGHVHGNREDATHPYSISTACTCDGKRAYRIIRIHNNEMVFNQAVDAGSTGSNLSQIYNANKSMVTINNTFNFDLEDCMVKFTLEDGLEMTSLTNAELYQIDSLATPKIVYAYVDVPANSQVEASMQTDTVKTSIDNIIPTSPFLMNLYPNPFNPKLAINYELSSTSDLDISIYDLQGKLINTLYSGFQEAGHFNLNWHAGNNPTGLYFIKAHIKNTDGQFQVVEKCLLMK